MKYATAFSFLFLFFIGLALPQTVEAAPSACLKKLTGKNGCYDSAGSCKQGFQYCLTASLCKNNGGDMVNGTCVARGTGQGANSDLAAACATKSKGTYGPIDDGYGCYCYVDDNGVVKLPQDFGGVCAEKSKNVVAAAGDASAECSRVNGSYLSYDQDESSACYCLGERSGARKINPSAGESCAKSASTGNSRLDQCLQKWETKAEECKVSAERAVKSCDEDKSTDEGAVYVRSFAKDFLNAQLKSRAGTGSASECARGSLIGNTALTGLNSMKTTCDESFGTCNSECAEVNEASRTPIVANECGQFAVTSDEQIKLSNTISNIITTSLNGIKECTVEAKKQKGLLEQALDSYGKAAQAGKMCECQIAGAGANCNLVPNPNECLQGGRLFGQSVCNVFESCALGSLQFDSISCRCARDSSAAVCRTPAGKPAPSNFAVDLKPGTNGGVDVGGPTGGSDDSSMNLGGNYNVNKPGSEYKDPAETAKGGRSGSSGSNSGGGGGARGGGGDDPNAVAADEDDGSTKGLAGLFNQAKSSFSNMLGGGNKATGKVLSPNGGRQGLQYDINKWRPRGLASAGCQGNQVRCKNEDIFSIVNRRYDVNEPTFLFGP